MSSVSNNETYIENAHIRPEVIDIINLLIKMGAKISYKNSSIFVKGNDKLSGVDYFLMDDIIEAFTFAIIGATTKKEILIKNYPFNYLKEPTGILKESGAKLRIDNENLVLSKGEINFFNLKTAFIHILNLNCNLYLLPIHYSRMEIQSSLIIDSKIGINMQRS